MNAKETFYNGVKYKSKLEACTAQALDDLGLVFSYESVAVIGGEYRGGMQYTPDFYIPGIDLIIECVGVVDDEHLDMARKFCGETPYSGIVDHRDGDGLFLIVGDSGILHDPFYPDQTITIVYDDGSVYIRRYDGNRRLFESNSIIDLGYKVRCRNMGYSFVPHDVASAMRTLHNGKPYESPCRYALFEMATMFDCGYADISYDDGVVSLSISDGYWHDHIVGGEYCERASHVVLKAMLTSTLRVMRDGVRAVMVTNGDVPETIFTESDMAADISVEETPEAIDNPPDAGSAQDDAIPYIYGENVEHEYPGVTVTFETIDQQTAEAMFEHNENNRKMKDRSYCIDSIAKGEWKVNGATICFADDDTLIDGQHRLYGVVTTGRSIETVVVRGLSRDSQITMDTGTPTKLEKILKSYGYRRYGDLATVARMLRIKDLTDTENAVRSAKGAGNILYATPMEMYAYFRKNKDRIKNVLKIAAQIRDWVRGVPLGGLACVLDDIDDIDGLEEFVRQVVQQFGASNTAIALNRYLRNNDVAKPVDRKSATAVCAVFAKAWNAHASGVECKVLRFDEAREKFPTVMKRRRDAA